MSEAYPEAAAILSAAGWGPHPEWQAYTRGPLVVGVDPSGTMHIKDFTRIPPGHPLYGPDTPDTAEEAALWLVKWYEHTQAPRVQEDIPHEANSTPAETVEHPSSSDADGDGDSVPRDAGTIDGDAAPGHDGQLHAYEGRAVDLGGDILDAEYDAAALALAAPEIVLDGELADPLALPEPELEDFIPDEIKPAPEGGPGAFIFGDNLDQMRTAAIGLVVRASRQRQAEYAALMGGHDFAALQGRVLRDTVDGRYVGPQEVYALFVELSQHQNAINRIRYAEAEKVEFLEAANREQVEAFDPEDDWP